MKAKYIIFPIFFAIISLLYAEEKNTRADEFPLHLSEQNLDQTIQLAKSLEDADESDEDYLDEDYSANTTKAKFPKKTNGSYKINAPSNNANYSIAIPVEDLDPERQKQLTKEGLKLIETNEPKNNKAAVKQISRLLLTNPIPEVRAEAARALGRMGKGFKALHRAIETDGYEVKQHAYKALEKIGSRSSLKYFIKGARSSDIDIKIASFKGLGKTRSSQGRDMIIKYGLTSKDPSVVGAALDGLGHFSRKDDLEIFKKYLKSEVPEHQSGAVRGLGNSRLPETLDTLSDAINENPGQEAEIIFAISKKRTLAATLLLLKMMQTNKNESYQAIIQRELNLRRAFGKYAVIRSNSATLKKLPKPNSEKVMVMANGDVAKIKKITEKRFKVKMNNNIVEDRYYLLQAVNNSKEDSKRGTITEAWVFGAKINIVNIVNPAKGNKKDGWDEEDLADEDSEDEKEVARDPSITDIKTDKKVNTNPNNNKNTTVTPAKTGKEDYYEGDEDEDD